MPASFIKADNGKLQHAKLQSYGFLCTVCRLEQDLVQGTGAENHERSGVEARLSLLGRCAALTMI